jgi:N-acetylmuramoyl-L-alanine amidase
MDITRRSFACFGATALGGLAATGRAFAEPPSAIRGVLVQEVGAASRVTLALDRPAQAHTFFLSDPFRFVIDVANSQLELAGGSTGQGAGAGLVRRFRYAPQADGVSRVVLDLEAPANLVRQELSRRSASLSFDIAPTVPVAPPPAPLERPGRQQTRRTIVIDAGHGGRDPGAIGVNGAREKDVVLHCSLMLREALEQRGYRVALTRDADAFVELQDRVRFARTQHADLFISIHADASPNSETTGASVYTLSDSGANRAQNMMASQNWDLDLGDTRDAVARDILVDLAQRDTTNRSAQFARIVIPRLGRVAPLLRNTHRNAGFFVLLAPDVPAVLIETGFLSNVTDERRLSDPRARERMAQAMAEAVDAYFAAPALYAAAD